MNDQLDVLKFFRRAQFSVGELSRVRQITRANGTTLILPYDQFLEHDCRHLEAKSDAGNPDYIIQLGLDTHFNAVAIHYGLAKRYWSKFEGKIPLLLKINGKTSIPSDDYALSVHTSFVEDAVRIGAVAVGYTMYYGTPRQDEDLPQLAAVREECDRFGMPLVIWAYPRGAAIAEKGGKDTSYALESAARLAAEMGTTIIKSNLPQPAKEGFLENKKIPSYYRDLERELQKMEPDEASALRAKRVVDAAQGIPVLFSGGSDKSEEDMIKRADACVKGGCFGFIVGRNMWKRPHEDALKMGKRLAEFLDTRV